MGRKREHQAIRYEEGIKGTISHDKESLVGEFYGKVNKSGEVYIDKELQGYYTVTYVFKKGRDTEIKLLKIKELKNLIYEFIKENSGSITVKALHYKFPEFIDLIPIAVIELEGESKITQKYNNKSRGYRYYAIEE
jgi:hypothetical protein